MDIAIVVIQNFEANYPELLGRIFVINGISYTHRCLSK